MGSKRSAAAFGALALVLFLCAAFALYKAAESEPPHSSESIIQKTPLPTERFSLVIEPRDGMAPLQALIKSASSSIDLVMYEFDDMAIEQLLAAKAKSGVAVRVILDNGYFGGGSSVNEEAYDYLRSHGVQVRWSPEYFALTHQKSLVVDGKTALVMSFNLTPQYYKSDRDFGVVDTGPNDVAAIEGAFESDWAGRNVEAQNGDDLVWSPGSRQALLALIQSATSSLEVYNEEMDDGETTLALEAAAKRGVDVEVVMTYSSEWQQAFRDLSGAGVRIRTYAANAPLYIHAKVIIADDMHAFVGSENFSPTSLEQNRELGIIVSDPGILASLTRVFAGDWEAGKPFLLQ